MGPKCHVLLGASLAAMVIVFWDVYCLFCHYKEDNEQDTSRFVL